MPLGDGVDNIAAMGNTPDHSAGAAASQVAASHIAPDQVAPDQVAPGQVAPGQVAPGHVALDERAGDSIAPTFAGNHPLDDSALALRADAHGRRILPFLLVFLYVSFLYNYGAKFSTMLYTDFPSMYYSARLAFVQKQSPYDKEALTAARDKAEPPREHEVYTRIYPFLYPPPSLVMLYPLARLNPMAAKVALLAVNHLCLFAILAMVMIPIAGFTPREVFTRALPASLALYLLYARGMSATIELGQVNLIILALLCLAWWGIKKDWNWVAIATPLGLACIFKFYPILFVGLLVFRRRWLAAAGTIGVIALVTIASYFMVPRVLWHDWITQVLPTTGYLKSPLHQIPPTIAPNIGVAGFMARIFLPPKLAMEYNAPNPGPALIANESLGRLLTVAVLAILCLITFAAVWLSTRRGRAVGTAPGIRLNLEFSAILVMTVIVAPLAWEHHLAYVAPAAVIAILAVIGHRIFDGRAWVVLLAIVCLLGWPLNVAKLPLPRIPQILAVSTKLYVLLGLWGFLLHELLRRERPASPVAAG